MTSELFIGNRVESTQAVVPRRSTSRYEGASLAHLLTPSPQTEADNLSDDLDVSQSPQPSPDLFDLRQDVMRYTNPLRAKVLLFSLLYRTLQTNCTEEVLLLKSHRLDQLLEAALCRYPQYKDLAVQLKQAARQLDDPVEYDQVSDGILRSVQSYYGRHSSC